MSQCPVVTVFYSFDEIDIKDVESELFTRDKEKFHIFFFHNKELHFKKSTIFSCLLEKKFRKAPSEFFYNPGEKSVRLHKKMDDFDLEEFEKEVEVEYNHYLERITYRVECIFQTFTLFMELYKDKPLVFVFPNQIYDEFQKIITEKKLNFQSVNKSNNFVQKFEIFYWIHYYSRKDLESDEQSGIPENNISGYYLLEPE